MKYVYVFILIVIAALPVLLIRFNAPEKYDLHSASIVSDGGYVVKFPIGSTDIFTGYYLDGGSIGIGFTDNSNVRHMIWLDHTMGGPQDYSEIRIGPFNSNKRPDLIVRDSKTFNSIAYSLMAEKEKQGGCEELVSRYPRFLDYIKLFSVYFYRKLIA